MVTYLDYCAGSTKGTVNRGHSFNSVFGLGANDGTYTSSLVGGEAKADAGADAYKATLNWAPVTPGTVEILSTASSVTTSYFDYVFVDGKKVPSVTDGVGKIFTAAGVEVSGASITYATGEIAFPAATFAASTEIKANYA